MVVKNKVREQLGGKNRRKLGQCRFELEGRYNFEFKKGWGLGQEKLSVAGIIITASICNCLLCASTLQSLYMPCASLGNGSDHSLFPVLSFHNWLLEKDDKHY